MTYHPAIVLFSGGIDSTTTLAVALRDNFRPILLTFDYGQRHRIEIEKSKKVLRQFGELRQLDFKIDLRQIGGSSLTGNSAVPKNREADRSIPPTYVPARNIIFLSIAAGFGEVYQAYDLFFGANIIDYSGYPDCRPEFIEAMQQTLRRGTKAGSEGKSYRIHAPLLYMSKPDILRKGIELGVDYTYTHSCYDPGKSGQACGACDSCVIRAQAFRDIGLRDPAA